MNSISQAYTNALLADATYALGKNGQPDASGATGATLQGFLKDRITQPLAKYIGDNYTVVTHIETSDVLGSGFDATVWKNNTTGKLSVSMQGSSGLQDFLTDVDLAVSGNARNQLVTMVNWWLKISTPAGQSAKQIQLETIYDNSTPPIALGTHFIAAPSVQGSGLVSAAQLAQGIEVNGHSLGGYLATAFTRLFATQAHVTTTSTFNSAGFAPGSESVFKELQSLLGADLGLNRFPNGTEQSNYFAVNGTNVTTNSFWFNQQGQRVELYQEEGTGSANHYIYKLTDYLALGAALETLSPSLTFATLNDLIKVGSNDMKASYEGVLDAARQLVSATRITDTQLGDAGDNAASRADFHTKLAALQANTTFKSLAGKLSFSTAAATATSAKTDFAQFLSLYDLSPFSMSVSDAAANESMYAVAA